MSELEEKTEKYVTERVRFVTYKGKMPSASHQGAHGTPYFFAQGQGVRVDRDDEKNYARKNKNNPQNWQVEYRDIYVYEEVHKIKFKGTSANPDEIMLHFDDESITDGEKKMIPIIFKVDEWVTINDDKIAKTMSDKCLSTGSRWSYQLDKIRKVK